MLKTELVFLFSMWMIFCLCLKKWEVTGFGHLQSYIQGGMPDTSLPSLVPKSIWISWWVQGAWQPKSGADPAVTPTPRVGRRQVLHLLPLQSASRRWDLGYVMWCVTSSSLGLPSGWGGKTVLVEMMWWKHVQASSTVADYQPFVALRYINSIRGNSFLRRVCSSNFSQNCEQNAVGITLVCVCPCLSNSFCL